MKRLLILAAATAFVVARPETYKEQEEFQYSRSSSDDGSKSGFYGAQRGNMGGNYERAHNMDSLAQNQMSGVVRQVNGELGDGANTRSGSVYSAANSRGTYGSGHYDLSNLAGRNFQEGSYYDNSQSRSSLTQASNSHSHRYGGSQRAASDVYAQSDDLQSLANSQRNNAYNYGSSSHSSSYGSQSGFQERSQYNRDNSDLQAGHRAFYRVTPVKVVVTPGGRVAVPVTAQLYDASQGSSVISQNALDTDTEVTNDNVQGSGYRPSNSRFYESSYRYNKKWEKHDTIPTSISVVIPTESSIPTNSELYEDSNVGTSSNQYDSRRAESQTSQSSSGSSRYNAARSSSSQSRHQSNYNLQYRDDTNSNTNAFAQTGYNAHHNQAVSSDSSNAQSLQNAESRYHGAGYNTGSQLDLNSQVENLNTRPKSYQSSYSYHKSWERQGDPYVIKPASNGYYGDQSSQRLSSSTKNLGGYATYQSGSQYGQNLEDCDENGHRRVARSYNMDTLENTGQQSQSNWDQQNVGQQSQSQWDNLEELGQQSQSSLDQLSDGQQSQSQWDNLENLNQQSQSNLDQLNVGQQSQSQWDKLEDLNQQSQSNLDQQNVGQQSQSQWDKLEDLNQQSQSNLDQLNVGQPSQSQQDKLEDLNQQSQTNLDQLNVGQQSQSQWDKLEDLSQQSQTNVEQQNVGQQSQSQWDKLEDLNQQSQTNVEQQNVGHQSQSQWDKLEDLNQQSRRPQHEDNQNTHTQSEQRNQLEDNKPIIDFQHLQTNNENEHGHHLHTQSNNKNKTEDDQFYGHQTSNNEDTDQQHSDIYTQQESHSYKDQWQEPGYDIGQNTEYNGNRFPNYGEVNSNIHINSHSQGNWQEHAVDTDNNTQENNFYSNSQGQGLSSLWAKFDNIDTESSHINQITNSSTSLNSKRNQTYSTETSIDSHIQSNIPISEYQTMLPPFHKDLLNNLNKSKDTNTSFSWKNEHGDDYKPILPPNHEESSSNNQPETPQDVGRGDISPEDLTSDISDGPYNNDMSQNTANNSLHNNVTSKVDQNTNMDMTSQLSIQELHENNTEKEEKHIVDSTERIELSVLSLQEKVQKVDQNVSYQNATETLVNNEEQENINNYHQGNMQNFHQENMYNFDQQNMHNFDQGNTHSFDQENMHNYNQENLHNFDQGIMHNLDQTNMYNFNQRNMHNFDPSNMHNFDQENMHNFHQEHLSVQQQNVHNFEQENLNVQQQNVHDFGQQNVQFFVQHDENLEQQNLHTFNQENGFDVGQQYTGQPYFPDSMHNNEQQNLNTFQQENVEDRGQYDNQFSQEIKIPFEIVTREQLVQEIHHESRQINRTEPVEVQTISQPVTEKTGFWKSVSNKVTNAKDKVVSWFRSI